MDIKTIQDVAKLADVCRKKGIKQIKVSPEGVEIVLGERPTRSRAVRGSTQSNIQTEGSPTQEEILYWSSLGASEMQ